MYFAAEVAASTAITDLGITRNPRASIMRGLYTFLGALFTKSGIRASKILKYQVRMANCLIREENAIERMQSGVRPRSHFHVSQYRKGIEPKQTLDYLKDLDKGKKIFVFKI